MKFTRKVSGKVELAAGNAVSISIREDKSFDGRFDIFPSNAPLVLHGVSPSTAALLLAAGELEVTVEVRPKNGIVISSSGTPSEDKLESPTIWLSDDEVRVNGTTIESVKPATAPVEETVPDPIEDTPAAPTLSAPAAWRILRDEYIAEGLGSAFMSLFGETAPTDLFLAGYSVYGIDLTPEKGAAIKKQKEAAVIAAPAAPNEPVDEADLHDEHTAAAVDPVAEKVAEPETAPVDELATVHDAEPTTEAAIAPADDASANTDTPADEVVTPVTTTGAADTKVEEATASDQAAPEKVDAVVEADAAEAPVAPTVEETAPAEPTTEPAGEHPVNLTMTLEYTGAKDPVGETTAPEEDVAPVESTIKTDESFDAAVVKEAAADVSTPVAPVEETAPAAPTTQEAPASDAAPAASVENH